MNKYSPEFAFYDAQEPLAGRLDIFPQQEYPQLDHDTVDLINIRLTEIEIRSNRVLGTPERQADWATLTILEGNTRRLEAQFAQQTEYTDFFEYAQSVLGEGVTVVLSTNQIVSVLTVSEHLDAMLQTHASDPNFGFLQLATEMMLGRAVQNAPGNVRDFATAQTLFTQMLEEQMDSGDTYDEALAAVCSDLGLSVELGQATIQYLNQYLEHIVSTGDTAATAITHDMVEQGTLADSFPPDYSLETLGVFLIPQEAYNELVEQYKPVTVASPRHESVEGVPPGMVAVEGTSLMPPAQVIQQEGQILKRFEEILAGTSNGTYLEGAGVAVPVLSVAFLTVLALISKARRRFQ